MTGTSVATVPAQPNEDRPVLRRVYYFLNHWPDALHRHSASSVYLSYISCLKVSVLLSFRSERSKTLFQSASWMIHDKWWIQKYLWNTWFFSPLNVQTVWKQDLCWLVFVYRAQLTRIFHIAAVHTAAARDSVLFTQDVFKQMKSLKRSGDVANACFKEAVIINIIYTVDRYWLTLKGIQL